MTRVRSHGSRRWGVTLIELLVALGIIGILLGLLLPAVQQARASADRLRCQNQLRQIGLALHGYHDSCGTFPPGQDSSPFGAGDGSTKGISWLAKILPYVEQQPLWDQTIRALALDRVPWHDPPHVGLASVVPLYGCPMDPRVSSPQRELDGILAAYTSYVGVQAADDGANNGVLPLGTVVRISQITDGTSQTVMVGERPPSARLDSGWWYASHWNAYSHDFILPAEMEMEYPGECLPAPPATKFMFGPGRIDNECDKYHFWSLHTAGANFLFADGSVHFLSYSIRPLLRDLASRDGGEVVTLP